MYSRYRSDFSTGKIWLRPDILQSLAVHLMHELLHQAPNRGKTNIEIAPVRMLAHRFGYYFCLPTPETSTCCLREQFVRLSFRLANGTGGAAAGRCFIALRCTGHSYQISLCWERWKIFGALILTANGFVILGVWCTASGPWGCIDQS